MKINYLKWHKYVENMISKKGRRDFENLTNKREEKETQKFGVNRELGETLYLKQTSLVLAQKRTMKTSSCWNIVLNKDK